MNLLIDGKAIGLAAVLLAWPALAPANVGDTLADLRGRYGSAKDVGGQMLFEVRLDKGQIVPARDAANGEDHLTITVYFDGSQSAMEIFTRNTSDPAKAELSSVDINTILNAAGDGHAAGFDQEWQPIELPTGRQTWVSSDKKLIARFSPNKTGKIDDASVLVIMLNADK